MTITRGWKHRLRLKDIIEGDKDVYTSDEVAAAAKTMHERLESFRLQHAPDDDTIEQISDEFHTIAFIDGPAGAACQQEFNLILDGLYDWADNVRVWID